MAAMSGARKPKLIDRALVAGWRKPRAPESHKGDFGHVLVLAGSRGMTGAAVMAAQAAMRAGAGLTTVGTPVSQQPIVASHLAEAMTTALPETAEGSLSTAALQPLRLFLQERGIGRLVVGPGLSTHPRAVEAVLDVIETIDLPMVLDADALNALSSLDPKTLARLFERRKAASVLTPHPGEMGRLLKMGTTQVQADRLGAATALAQALRCVVVLKGRGTIVADPKAAFLNATGNPGLAKGGAGDVLAGLIAGLWAQRPGGAAGALEAACSAVYLHGLAADLAVEEIPEACLLPSDVLRFYPAAVKTLADK